MHTPSNSVEEIAVTSCSLDCMITDISEDIIKSASGDYCEAAGDESAVDVVEDSDKSVTEIDNQCSEKCAEAISEFSSSETFSCEPVLHFLNWLLSRKTMGSIIISSLIFLLSSSIYQSVREVWSRPTIVPPRASRPFFSNASSSYITDYYSGNLRTNRVLKTTDVLIVMYYAPWSSHSRLMQHSFEVAARMYKNKKYIRFVAVNCWAVGGECRSNYKLHTYPVIMAYSNTVSLSYGGELSTDQLYRWIQRISTPLKRIQTISDLQQIRSRHQNVVVGYFPFKAMETPPGYRAFAAAAMLLASGRSNDESIVCTVVTSLALARQLGIRYEGDIQFFRATESSLSWPQGVARNAQEITAWVRNNRFVPSYVHWIQLNRNDELFSESMSRLLNESALIMLVTNYSPIYQGQGDLTVFTQIAKEYWSCEEDDILDGGVPLIRTDDREQLYGVDKMLCDQIANARFEVEKCCRSLRSSVDWNMACASSAKYKWEYDEAQSSDEEIPARRRSHWVEQVIPFTSSCQQYTNESANSLIGQCCSIYEEISEPSVYRAQLVAEEMLIRRRQQYAVDSCMRSKLYDYTGHSMQSFSGFDEHDPTFNNSLRGYGCAKNDTLKFVVIDARYNSHFLDKWGVDSKKIPMVNIVDSSREVFSLMDKDFSEESLRSFVRDYHQHVFSTAPLDEQNTKSRFVSHPPVREEIRNKVAEKSHNLIRLTRLSFLEMLNSENSTVDQLVFFSGGNWHAPSTSVLHVMHAISRYFSNSNLSKFYVLDTSRNEIPYNFNFEKLPAVVLFLADRRDISWKFPETLPLSVSNLLSFVLSRCSPKLRWRSALTTCDRHCSHRNRHRLRRHLDVLLRDLHTMHSQHNSFSLKWRENRLAQLRALRSTLRVLHASQLSADGVSIPTLDKLLHSKPFVNYFNSLDS